MPVVLLYGGKEYLPFPVSSVSGETPSEIEVALVPRGTARGPSTTWHTAELTATGGQILVGVDPVNPTPGRYRLYVRATADPELPMRGPFAVTIR